MNNTKDLQLLKELSELNGISGHERNVKKFMEREFIRNVSKENILYDGLGSVIAKVGHGGPKIMIAGHMDEVGMIVTKITDDGFLKFQTIGGWYSQVMLAQQFDVTTIKGDVYRCVMGSKPPHILTQEERKVPADIDQMYLDLGASSKQEVEQLGIRIGDMITPHIEFHQMANGDFLLGKAWDDRIGCAVVLGVLEAIANDCDHCYRNTVYCAATVQEEVGLRGAKTAAQLVQPDIAISLDVSIAKDVPGTDGSIHMGKGPDILIYDGSLVGHVGLRDLFIETAEENNIPYQLDYLKSGGTDAGSMHLAHHGAPSIALCIASRYIHSHTSMISKKDYENCVKLIVNVIRKLDKNKVDEITYN